MKILVVEDEKELLASIGEGLELDGYYVDLVDNGTQALEMAQLEQYDLILLASMVWICYAHLGWNTQKLRC